ncbi:MAG: hypothetical protein WBD36_05835 [Bacteroidota bacterium]
MKALTAFLALFLFSSCSAPKQSIGEQPFKVELFSSGGFAGTASGVTVTSNGWAMFWQGRSAALQTVVDSVKLSEETRGRIFSLLGREENFSVNSQTTGNMTTTLMLQLGQKSNRVSFAGQEVPTSFPDATKELILELRTLHAK